jgi:hypothetical protein
MATKNGTPQVSPVAQIRALHERLIRAEALVAENRVHPVVNLPGHCVVQGNTGFYVVNGECHCPDATNRSNLLKGFCKHRLAALVYAEQMQDIKDMAPQKDEGLEEKVNDLYR